MMLRVLVQDHALRTALAYLTALHTNSRTSPQSPGARLTDLSLTKAQVGKESEIRALTWPKLLLP